MATPAKPILAISIDFGTTFSGISYAESSLPITHPSENFTIWPRVAKIRAFHKVPTLLAYPRDPTLGLPILWGFDAERLGDHPEGYIRCAAFKPLLDASERDLAAGTIRGGLVNLPPGKGIEDLCRDFIELLWEHFEATISERGYSKWNYDYHVLFTVPATFSEMTVEKFRRVIHRTSLGIHTFEVSLTEPEAAGMYAIYKQPVHQFHPGDVFVVCDAGGGTVDLCSYTILASPPAFKLEQTGVVTGDFCGSSNINKAFEAYLHGTLGAAWAGLGADERYELLRQFNERKEEFEDDEAAPNAYLSLPHSLSTINHNLPTRGAMLSLSRDLMKSFFKDSVTRTTTLLTAHINMCKSKGKNVRYVYLVGGFGTSPYLSSSLKAALAATYPDPPVVVTPQAAQLAVTDGALRTLRQRLLPGEADPVQSRLLRTSYGLLCSLPFNPNKHDPNSTLRYIHPQTGKSLMRNQIIWLARRGEAYPTREKCITAELRRAFQQTSELWVEKIVGSDLDGTLPTSFDGAEKGVRLICQIHTSLALCPESNFTPITKERKGFCGLLKKRVGSEVKFGVVMKIASAGVGFSTVWGGEGGRKVEDGVVRVEWEISEVEKGVEEMDGTPVVSPGVEMRKSPLSSAVVSPLGSTGVSPMVSPRLGLGSDEKMVVMPEERKSPMVGSDEKIAVVGDLDRKSPLVEAAGVPVGRKEMERREEAGGLYAVNDWVS